jgi:hypothetical protein
MIEEKIKTVIEQYEGYAYPLLEELLDICSSYKSYVGTNLNEELYTSLLICIAEYISEEDEMILGPMSLQYKIEERDFVIKHIKDSLLVLTNNY